MIYYRLLKLNTLFKNPRIKLLGLFILHIFRQRYLAVHFDPVLSCNLRCRMCHFSDKDYVRNLKKSSFKEEELPLMANAILENSIKLQIGCAAEPTLYKNISQIMKQAKEYNVSQISLTTNARLLTEERLKRWVDNGLDEIIISTHGLNKKTYDEMMPPGKFEDFLQAISIVNKIKKKYPGFSLRINYTFNSDNFMELDQFWEVYKNYEIDVLQIRPIVRLGESDYNNFDLGSIVPHYSRIYTYLKEGASNRGSKLIAPLPGSLKKITTVDSIIQNFTYCYISPDYFFRDDFKWRNEDFRQYTSRTKWAGSLLKAAFSSRKKINMLKTGKLNYGIV